MLRCKIDALNMVQQTLLCAHEKRHQYRGQTEAERKGWLREILLNAFRNQVRDLTAARREIDRELPLAAAVVQASARPDQDAQHNEQRERLNQALDTLPAGRNRR